MPGLPRTVIPLPALNDNYIWSFATGPQTVAVVDPGAAAPVLEHLAEHGGRLSHILLTHHHADHIGGVEELRACSGARVIGAAADSRRLPRLDHMVGDGATLMVGEIAVQVLELPGHTTGHVAYVAGELLFPGDTLFSCGCGRLFEGSPAQMWSSLLRLRALPAATRVCPAHEYTLVNLKFAQALDPEDSAVAARLAEVLHLTDQGVPTLPVTLEQERRLNPFLRCDDPDWAARVGWPGLAAVEVFAALRERRNRF